MFRTSAAILGLVVGLAGCSDDGGDVDNSRLSCTIDDDCGSGWLCGDNDRCTAAYSNRNGVSSGELVVGNSSGTTTGNATKTATAVVDGIQALFSHVNTAGGVHGRQLILDQRDDGYEAEKAASNVRAMVEPKGDSRAVFALIGNYGSSPAAATAPIAGENKTPFFGAISGSSVLRNVPPDRYVFNFRAGLAEEGVLAARFMTDQGEVGLHPRNTAVFAQGTDNTGTDKCTWDSAGAISCTANEAGLAIMDAFGRAGFDGVWQELKDSHSIPLAEIIYATYTRNKQDVQNAAQHFLTWLARPKAEGETKTDGTFDAGIVLSAVRAPSADLVEELTDAVEAAQAVATDEPFSSGSYSLSAEEVTAIKKLGKIQYVGTALSQVFADKLNETGKPEKYCKNVLALQVVPDPGSGGSLAIEYRERLAAYDSNLVPSVYSLEGYIAAKIFVEALKAQGADITTESFVNQLESMSSIDVGLGVPLGFSAQDHQASHTVWGRKLKSDCTFEDAGEFSL